MTDSDKPLIRLSGLLPPASDVPPDYIAGWCDAMVYGEGHVTEMLSSQDTDSLVYRLRKRAEIRRQITTRKSVQEGEPDRIADLLDEAATALVLAGLGEG